MGIRFYPADVQCHGSYIRDHKRWVFLRVITREKAAELLTIPKELQGDNYMWTNKGYLVLGRPYKIHDTQVGEGTVSDDLNLVSGDRAIAIQDGEYHYFEYK